MITPETRKIGLGDVDDARLGRSIDVMAEAYKLPEKPKVSQVFDRSFLPPLDERSTGPAIH